MKILFTLLILSVSAFAVEDEKTMITRMVKERKEELLLFREKVSQGNRCKLRDYKCFKNEVMLLGRGHPEDLMYAQDILLPFYLRSIKEGDFPCEGSCLQNLLAQHIDTYLSFVLLFHTAEKKNDRTSAYPTIDATRIRAIMDLSAVGSSIKSEAYLRGQLKALNPEKITDPEVKDVSKLSTKIDSLTNGSLFAESILCRLNPGNLVYDEILRGESSKKQSEKRLAEWMKAFAVFKTSVCKNTAPLDYRGTDASTKKHYAKIRDRKLAGLDECRSSDFGCLRRQFRGLGIHYAEDVTVVEEKMKSFVAKSTPATCNDTCQAQMLISVIQTWITYFSTFDRSKLASTMDWKIYPEAKYDTIAEDLSFFLSLRAIFDPLLMEFGKIDPARVSDEGLKSEMKSVGKDLSDLASGRMLKDSVICMMEPWIAAYDKYLSPTSDSKKNKKFEAAFLEFKSAVCK